MTCRNHSVGFNGNRRFVPGWRWLHNSLQLLGAEELFAWQRVGGELDQTGLISDKTSGRPQLEVLRRLDFIGAFGSSVHRERKLAGSICGFDELWSSVENSGTKPRHGRFVRSLIDQQIITAIAGQGYFFGVRFVRKRRRAIRLNHPAQSGDLAQVH